jgi:NCS2 family nucleobase:cation symporter-2
MTIVSAAFESAISRLSYRLRPFLPPELSGLVVLLIGLQLAAVGLSNLFAPSQTHSPASLTFGIAFLTLATMVVLNIWTRGIVKLLCVLIGVIVGYVVAYLCNLISPESIAAIDATPIFALPRLFAIPLSFNAEMVIPFAVAGLATAMATSANITVVQRLNDADWVRPDLITIARGTLTDGLVAATSGLLGSTGVGAISANVGVMVATGVTSRRIAVAFAAMALVFAVLPRFSAILAITPQPVVAGALLFASTFTSMSGLQIITSRLIDARKTLMIGLSLSAALAIYINPHLGDHLPSAVRPLIGSAMVTAILVAIALTALFRLGVRRRVTLTVQPGARVADTIEDFALRNGSNWGARPDVIRRAIFAVTQLTEVLFEHCAVKGPIAITAEFDEFNLNISVDYDGDAMEFPDRRPSNEEILDSEQGARRLAGFMLRRNADRIESVARDHMRSVHFHFDH